MKNMYMPVIGKYSIDISILRRFIIFIFILSVAATKTTAQVFSENIGTPGATTGIPAYTGWQNNGVLSFTGSGDVRTSTASFGYTGASGNGNVFLTNTTGTNFQIASINTTGLSGFLLTFGLFKSTTGSDATELTVEVSSDGVSYTSVTFPAQATGTGTAIWRLVTITGGTIPATGNLRIRFTNTSSAVQFRIDDIILNYSKYYKTLNTGDWNGTTTWSSSPDGVMAYTANSNPPNSNDAKVEILNTHTVTISTTGVSFKNAFVKSGGTLELATNNAYTIGGAGTNLTVESGGNLLLNFPSTGNPVAILGTGTCLVKTGGTVTANNNSFAGFGSAMGDNYLRTTSKFTYEDKAVFDSKLTSTTLPSSGNESYFTTTAATDIPILRISVASGFPYGSSGINTFNCLLQANAAFSFTGTGTKTFRGGFSGTSTISQGGGQLILGTASVVPVLDGTIAVSLTANGMSLVNGVTVPITTGNVTVTQTGSGAISKAAGNFTVNGTIDLSDVLVSNGSGNVIVNGKLKTGNGNGFSGAANTTIQSGAGGITLNAGSTIEYNRAGPQAVTNQVSYQNIIFSGSSTKTAAVNFTVLQDLTITGGSAALSPGSNTINIAGNWTDYGSAGFTESTSTVDFNGTGAQSITTGSGEDFFKVKKSAAGTLTLNSDARFAGTSSELNISAGTLDAGTFVLSGTASTALTMTGGLLKLARLAVTLPQFAGTYALSGASTIQLYGAGAQVLTGGVAFRNLTFSNTTSTTLASNPTSITGTVYITNSAILDIGSSNAFGTNVTNLTMDGGRFRMAGVGSSKPDIDGTYALTAGVVEFYGSSGTRENIKGKNAVSADIGYQQIEVTGNNVGISTNNITLNAAGLFTVKTGGTYTMSDQTITGPTGSQTVTVENGGFFRTGNNEGFHGFSATFSNNSSLHQNIENIVLASGSTVEYMRDGDQPITNSPVLVYHHLTLTGTTGIKTAPATTLTINGNLTKSGTTSFAHNSGTIVMNGSASQAYNSTAPTMDFYNLTDNNTVDLTINNDLSVANELAFAANSKLNLEDGNISMKSTSGGTANVGKIPSTVTISYSANGRFIVERYIPAGVSHGKSWQFLAVPTNYTGLPSTQTINAAWQEGHVLPTIGASNLGTIITNNVAGAGFDIIAGGAPSLKTYVPATNGWIGVSNTTATDMYNQKGYMLFVRGDRNVSTTGAAATVTTLRTAGKIFDAATNTPPVTNIGSGLFESIGNPYASAIDFSNDAGVIKSANVQKVFYVWDPKLGGGYGLGAYQTFTKGDDPDNNYYVSPGGGSYGTSGSVNNTIQSGQAFFVHAVGGAGTVQFNENAKTPGSSLVTRPSNNPGNQVSRQLRTNLYVITNGSAILIDGVWNRFSNSYSNNVDKLDAIKVGNFGENIAIAKNGSVLAVERRATIANADTVFYKLGQLKLQQYQFEFTPVNISKPGLKAFLEDNFLNTKTAVSLNDTTRIRFNVTNDPGSYAADRFRLVFRKKSDPATIPANEVGDQTHIVIYPNPVQDKTIHLVFRDQQPGKYLVQLINQAGQNIMQQSIIVRGNYFVKEFSVSNTTAGIYQLAFTSPTGIKTTRQVVID